MRAPVVDGLLAVAPIHPFPNGCSKNVSGAWQAGFMIEQAVVDGRPGMALMRLRAAVAAERAAQAAQAAAILALAHDSGWDGGGEFDLKAGRMVRIGFDGTPLVDEALPLEIAALYGISQVAAVGLIEDVLNLHWRHELLWTAVVETRLPLWQARKLAQTAAMFGLSGGECALADARVAPLIGAVGWGRVQARHRAAILQLAPGKVTAYHQAKQHTRHVSTGTDAEDPTVSWMSARANTSDVKAFEHLLGLVTKALVELGDTDPIDIVRSKALGRMGDPEGILALLDGIEIDTGETSLTEKPHRRRYRPTAQVFVHVDADTLENGGVARVERLGAVLVDDLARLVGHHRIRLTPVLDTSGPEPVVDAYEVPDMMRELVLTRDRYDVFPYSCREARGLDLDHTITYVEGESGQTRPSNLGPLTRRAHRGKTHRGWRLDQPCPGVFWWQSPRGQVFRVGPNGTRDLTGHTAEQRRRLWKQDQHHGRTLCHRSAPSPPQRE